MCFWWRLGMCLRAIVQQVENALVVNLEVGHRDGVCVCERGAGGGVGTRPRAVNMCVGGGAWEMCLGAVVQQIEDALVVHLEVGHRDVRRVLGLGQGEEHGVQGARQHAGLALGALDGERLACRVGVRVAFLGMDGDV